MKDEWLNFPRDNLRYKWFSRRSNEHGAKLECRTLLWLMEHYTSPGDTVLDPMSGVGTSMLMACYGRDVINVEISPQFIEIQKENRKVVQEKVNEFTGSVALLEGDCRLHLPLGVPIDAVIFSPPYGDVMKGKASSGKAGDWADRKNIVMGYDEQAGNVGNISIYPAYLEAMKVVYWLCFQSMKPGAPLVTVCKDYVKSGRRQFVGMDNIRLLLSLGFRLENIHRRYTDAKIFQILAARRREEKAELSGEAIDLDLKIVHEDLIVMRKP